MVGVVGGWEVGWNVSCQRRTLKWWKETIPKKLGKTGLMDVLATDIISGVPRAKKKEKKNPLGEQMVVVGQGHRIAWMHLFLPC